MPSGGDGVSQRGEAEQCAGGRGREEPGRKYAGFSCFSSHTTTQPPPHPRTGLQICSEAGRSGLLAWHPLAQATVNKLKLEKFRKKTAWEKLGPNGSRCHRGHRAFAVVTQGLVPQLRFTGSNSSASRQLSFSPENPQRGDCLC